MREGGKEGAKPLPGASRDIKNMQEILFKLICFIIGRGNQ